MIIEVLVFGLALAIFVISFMLGFFLCWKLIDHLSDTPSGRPEAALWGIPSSYVGALFAFAGVYLSSILMEFLGWVPLN